MVNRVQASIRKHRLIQRGQHVLVAVSGGADSVCTLCVMQELAATLGIKLSAAHLNHGIRGRAADEDAAFVRDLAGGMNVPLLSGRTDVRRIARREGISLEMAARDVRYKFLARKARKVGADVIVTGHTADDQAETVLLKLVRGAGAQGLGGIPRDTVLCGVRVMRPLLDESRKDIVAFLGRRHIAWREDNTNRDLSFLRNRVRHEILPVLEARLNPKVRLALVRAAEIMRDENQLLDQVSRDSLVECVSACGVVNVAILSARPVAVRRRVLRAWMVSSGVPAELLDFCTVDRIDSLLCGRKGSGRVQVPGNRTVERQYEQLLIGPTGSAAGATGSRLCGAEDAKHTGQADDGFRAAIKTPGETVLLDVGLRVVTWLERGIVKLNPGRPGNLPATASLSRCAVGRKKLFIRSWAPGDRIRPLGMAGSKKLQDIFVDTKVPAEQRHAVPLLECGGEIAWLPGYRVAQGWEVADAAANAWRIRIERI